LPYLDALDEARREAVSPVERLEHALHRWVAFVIMPLFAFANAGVRLGGASFEGPGLLAFAGVMVGLAIGKPLGIVTAAWVAAKLRVAALPRDVRWGDVLVVGIVAGIGFTMALFIAALAFAEGPLLESAKLAILGGSALSAGAGLALGRWLLHADPAPAGQILEQKVRGRSDGQGQ
jgi:NhaA family Na+:H+ antiporter